MSFQILIFNNIYLGGVFNPYIYVLIILSLPIETSAVLVLFIGFFTGLFLDLFSHTIGMHTMAFTLLAFLRPMMLKVVAPRDGFEFGTTASIKDFGWGGYAFYTMLLVFPHHLLLFTLEEFSSGSIWLMTQKVFANTILTTLIILIVQSFGKSKD